MRRLSTPGELQRLQRAALLVRGDGDPVKEHI